MGLSPQRGKPAVGNFPDDSKLFSDRCVQVGVAAGATQRLLDASPPANRRKKGVSPQLHVSHAMIKIGVAAGATQRLWMFPLLRIREKRA